MSDWKHKDEWKREGKNFMVSVVHYTETLPDWIGNDGGNRWNVYAYIYPKHAHFAKFEGSSLWQDATSELHFHSGCSFLRRHYKDDHTVASIQAGSDYFHYGDSFTFCATQESAPEVFSDADALFAQLERMEAES